MLKLRELIKRVRACKTAEEERSVVNKESAEMRNYGKESNNNTKCRNLIKCIYMHMMGYSTTFIQVTCVNLLASLNYTEKRIAYLSLSLLLDEKSEVLLLSTQTIKKDLDSQNTAIVALALNVIGEVFTAEMCRELSSEVRRLMQNTNPYIKKKAACACSKIIRKCPELTESYVENLYSYFEDKNHGVLICGLSLAIQIFKNDPNIAIKFNKYHYLLAKYLKNLIAVTYSPEFDVNGITDPFLQSKLLETLLYFGRNNSEISEELRDIISSVSNSIEGSKNSGNAVLYELVKTINGIEADTGLKSLSNTILSKFLVNRDNNYKYIALNTLREVVKTDVQSVQKHKTTILECLKDSDVSIKRRALDLAYLIVNSSNIKDITKECLNFLLSADDELKFELTTKISQCVERYAPSMKWKIDTFIKMLCLSYNYVSEDTISRIVNNIISAEDLKIYSVHKCYIAIKNNLDREALAKVAIYIIGEFGDILTSNTVLSPEDEQIIVTEEDVLCLLYEIEHINYSNSTVKEYIMNCYVKLANKFSHNNSIDKINSNLVDECKSFFFEVQQRAVEYTTFAKVVNSDLRKEVTKNTPNVKMGSDYINLNASVLEDDEETEISDGEKKITIKFKGINSSSTTNLPEKYDIFGGGSGANLSKSMPVNLLDNLAGIFTSNQIISENSSMNNLNVSNLLGDFQNLKTTNNLVNLQENKNADNIFNDIYNASANTTGSNNFLDFTSHNVTSKNISNPVSKEIFRNREISMSYSYTKQFDESYLGSVYVSSLLDKPLTNVNLKFMVLKFINLKVIFTSGTYLEPKQKIKKVKFENYNSELGFSNDYQ